MIKKKCLPSCWMTAVLTLAIHTMIYQPIASAGVVYQSLTPNGPLTYYEGDTATVTWSYSYSPSYGGSLLSDYVSGGSGVISWSGGHGSTEFGVSAANTGSQSASVTFLDDGAVGVSASGTLISTQNYGFWRREGWYQVWHTYQGSGSHAITGNLTLQVLNLDPIINAISTDLTVQSGDNFTFGASATDPGILDVLSYQWDFDQDGQYDDFLGDAGTWSYTTPGDYLVGLYVSDGDGGSAYSSFRVSVEGSSSAPTAAPEAGSLAVWSLLAIAASGSALYRRKRAARRSSTEQNS